MEFLSTIGKVVTGSSFEDTVYQVGMCALGGMKGFISGKSITVIPTLSMNAL